MTTSIRRAWHAGGGLVAVAQGRAVLPQHGPRDPPSGAVTVNNRPVREPDRVLSESDLLPGGFIILHGQEAPPRITRAAGLRGSTGQRSPIAEIAVASRIPGHHDMTYHFCCSAHSMSPYVAYRLFATEKCVVNLWRRPGRAACSALKTW